MIEGRSHFEYLSDGSLYFDAACQTLRPQSVLDAVSDYYIGYNACAGRVKYEWGRKVDAKVEETRAKVLKYFEKNNEYLTAFTLNTTYGVNLILGQLPARRYKKVVTSDIEHNSVFLPTVVAAKRMGVERIVLSRKEDGSIDLKAVDWSDTLVVLNSTSNIDGRTLKNLKELVETVHKHNGHVLIDAAQSAVHDRELIRRSDPDALFLSGHKMYAPSLGVIVAKKNLVSSLEIGFLGGGMVGDVSEQGFELSQDDLVSRLEPGLQNYSAIIGLNAALDWLETVGSDDNLSQLLFDELSSIPETRLLNSEPSFLVSFYSDKIDAHRLAIFLSEQGIMARSGYFCCHYYLKNKKGYPPLLRISLGLHNTKEDVFKLSGVLKQIIKNI